MKKTLLTTSILIALHATPLLAAAATADEALQGFDDAPSNSATDNALEGFDDAPATELTATKPVENKAWQLNGALTLGAAYNYEHEAPAAGQTDYSGLSRLRAKLNLEHDADINANWRSHLTGYGYYDLAYQLNGRDDYSTDVLDEYESELELGEAWLQSKLNQQTDLKLGRQIVVWGKSDNIRVTDIINPMDNREPGMTDIEDLRLPLAMARLDYYVGDWGISALAIPEIRFNKMPPMGSDFYPMPMVMPDEEIPGGTEYGLAANGTFSGWDLSFYAASLYDDNPHTVFTASGPELQHKRITMVGSAVNVAVNNWLLKGEIAQLNGLTETSLHRTDSLLGIEYSGFTDTSLSLEIANRQLQDADDEWQTALRYSGDFLHARLHLLAVVSAFGERLDEGGFGRYSAAYDIADGVKLTAGVVTYQSGSKLPFGAYGDNDRIFVDLKYSF